MRFDACAQSSRTYHRALPEYQGEIALQNLGGLLIANSDMITSADVTEVLAVIAQGSVDTQQRMTPDQITVMLETASAFGNRGKVPSREKILRAMVSMGHAFGDVNMAAIALCELYPTNIECILALGEIRPDDLFVEAMQRQNMALMPATLMLCARLATQETAEAIMQLIVTFWPMIVAVINEAVDPPEPADDGEVPVPEERRAAEGSEESQDAEFTAEELRTRLAIQEREHAASTAASQAFHFLCKTIDVRSVNPAVHDSFLDFAAGVRVGGAGLIDIVHSSEGERVSRGEPPKVTCATTLGVWNTNLAHGDRETICEILKVFLQEEVAADLGACVDMLEALAIRGEDDPENNETLAAFNHLRMVYEFQTGTALPQFAHIPYSDPVAE
jgi:hypothetical protein